MNQGTTQIKAAQDGKEGTTNLTVGPPALVSLAVTPKTTSVAVAGTRQFTATGTFTDNTSADITNLAAWASSDPAKATIGTNTGLATGVAKGTVTITASREGKQDTATLLVGLRWT